jgi:hypothetical protein
MNSFHKGNVSPLEIMRLWLNEYRVCVHSTLYKWNSIRCVLLSICHCSILALPYVNWQPSATHNWYYSSDCVHLHFHHFQTQVGATYRCLFWITLYLAKTCCKQWVSGENFTIYQAMLLQSSWINQWFQICWRQIKLKITYLCTECLFIV